MPVVMVVWMLRNWTWLVMSLRCCLIRQTWAHWTGLIVWLSVSVIRAYWHTLHSPTSDWNSCQQRSWSSSTLVILQGGKYLFQVVDCHLFSAKPWAISILIYFFSCVTQTTSLRYQSKSRHFHLINVFIKVLCNRQPYIFNGYWASGGLPVCRTPCWLIKYSLMTFYFFHMSTWLVSSPQ